MQPFGWILVEPFLKESELPAWPEQAINTEILQWQEAIQRRHQEEVARVEARNWAEREKRLEEERLHAAQAAIEKARQQVEAEEVARKQMEFDALTENQKKVYRLNELLEVFKAQPESLREPTEVNQHLNVLKEAALGWLEIEERKALANFMEAYYDLIGWYKKGANKKQKTRQEKKKRDLIQRIRQGSK